MGLYLIAASESSWGMFTFYSVMVLIGVNMIILAHEFGHFIVARLCGVKCEKFYVWFDVFGWRICRFQWGETEYGIGVLPLGGYVKMLGQEDNPARLREELERAKAARAAGDPFREKSPGANPDQADSSPEAIDVEAAEQALYDPRSYLSQSVPKRMAIISAGVIMNVIFALVAAVAAYPLGVKDVACAVGLVVPGKGAWQAGLRPGDEFEMIAGKPVQTFSDLKAAVSLGDGVGQGVSMVVRRPRVKESFQVTAVAERGVLAPEIGIGLPRSTTLAESLPVFPGSSADMARPAFQPGDRVVRINDRPTSDYAQIHSQLARHTDEPLTFTVQRTAESQSGSEKAAATEEITIEVAPMPMRRLGLVMKTGPITAIQDHSPAAEANLRPGDQILLVDGDPPGDPMTLPDRLRRLASGSEQARVVLTVSRDGEEKPLDVEVLLRVPDTFELPLTRESAVSVPALGIAYQVLGQVDAVLPGTPAEKAGLKPGDVVVQATSIPPDKEFLKSQGLEEAARKLRQKELVVKLGDDKSGWPFVLAWIQDCLPGTRLELELQDGGKVALAPVEADDWFYPQRGLEFAVLRVQRRADSPGEAIALGTQETVDSLLLIFRTLKALSTGQVSGKALMGPVGIVQVAYYSVVEGPGEFLLFLCLISANLAVINFLPIPVLDGGHMVFLAYEGIRGKPPSEGVFVGLSYLGLALILILMIWVIGLDFGCIARQ
ncbi:MAG TPA: site-2 protease family protein [Thermoguttaceae bacterium]|nr:site-2 protease family protein [Thermoguttaceae bacterium]